jgi:GntR family transcriptional regulator
VIRIDLDDPRPLEEQLVAALRFAIARGEVAPGEDLPSARQLAADLGVHWNTVSRAYRTLQAEGLVAVRQGRRATVARREAGSAPGARASLRTQLVEAIAQGRLQGLSHRDISEIFKDAVERVQERKRA